MLYFLVFKLPVGIGKRLEGLMRHSDERKIGGWQPYLGKLFAGQSS